MRISAEEINKIVNSLKNSEDVFTNIIPGVLTKYAEAECIKDDKGAVFVVDDHLIHKAYFIGNKNHLKGLLSAVPPKTSLEWIQRTEGECEIENLLSISGFNKYKVYARETTTYHSHPGDYPIKGKRAILREMYDPNCGEFAEEKDAEQLYELTRNTFDPYGDDIYTIDEWVKIIKENRCILYKEDSEIVTFYVFELQGKKLYSNLSLNKIGANILYNLEQRIFDQYWDMGIRTFYGWCDISNTKSLLRGDRKIPEAIKVINYLYNYIYIKE